MGEFQAIGVRLDSAFLRKIELLSKEERFDRSTAIRLLAEEGYKSFIQKKAAQNYISGKVTISKAAEKAGLTVWEMQQYLINNGFKSQYSIEDLKRETETINKKI